MQGWRGGDPKKMLIVPTEPVVKVAASPEATIFVTSNGKLYYGQYNGESRGTLRQVESV